MNLPTKERGVVHTWHPAVTRMVIPLGNLFSFLRKTGCSRAWPVVRVWIAVGCAHLLTASAVWGLPHNGIGLYTGPVGHSFVQRLVGGGIREFDSAGWGVAGDAQFVWNDQWSINPTMMFSLEKITEGNIEGDLVAYASALQVRRWWEDTYLGVHFGIYKEVIRAPTRTFGTGDGGIGFATGWEGDGGLLLNFQYDWERVLTGERIQAIRLQIGYRWR